MSKLTEADVLRFKASGSKLGAAPSEALLAFQMAYQTAKAAYMAAMRGNERLACLQGLGTIQNMTSALAGIAPEHVDNLSAIGQKAMRLLPVIKAEAVKGDALVATVSEDKQSRFERGKPADPTKHMSEEDADKWKAMNDEHKDNFKSAVSKVALSIMERLQLLSAFQVLSMGGSKAYGVSRDDALSAIERITGKHLIQDAKPPHGKSIEGYLEWLDSQGAVADGDKTAKLMSRQEKILKDYRADGGKAMDYDDLPADVQKALAKVKDQETLDSDANRWLGDNKGQAGDWLRNANKTATGMGNSRDAFRAGKKLGEIRKPEMVRQEIEGAYRELHLSMEDLKKAVGKSSEGGSLEALKGIDAAVWEIGYWSGAMFGALSL